MTAALVVACRASEAGNEASSSFATGCGSKASAEWLLVAGSNSAQEFSGFDEGAAAVGTGPEVWVFINDRYGAYPGTGLMDLTPAVLRLAAEQPVVLGHLDLLGLSVLRGADPLQGYIRSNLFVLGDGSLRTLGRLTSFATADCGVLFPSEWPASAPASGSTLLDRAYLERLAEWLTGRGGRLTSHWYRATDDPAERPALARQGRVHRERALARPAAGG